jgi:hypothetical protein
MRPVDAVLRNDGFDSAVLDRKIDATDPSKLLRDNDNTTAFPFRDIALLKKSYN